jgi:hypothetical protein
MNWDNGYESPDDTADLVLCELARELVQLDIVACWRWRLW